MSDNRSSIRANKYPIIGLVPETQTTAAAPAAPVPGQIYFDKTLNVLRQQILSSWVNFIMEGDTRLTNGRTPVGTAGGSLTGSYPSPTIAALAIVDSMVAAANKDGAAATPSMRTLGTGSTQAAAGNDSRFGMATPPNGAATGDLAGSYPSPSIAAGAVNLLKVGANIIPTGGSNGGSISGVAAAGDLAIRALGFYNGFAMPGKATLADILTGNGLTGPLNFSGYALQNVQNPSQPQDVATKSYVDAAIQGLSVKPATRVATTANINLAAPGGTIDGVLMSGSTNYRVLVKNQTTQSENGIYTFNGSSTPMTRVADMDVAAEFASAFVFVEEGATNANTGWYQTTDYVTLGTTAIVWTQFSAAGQLISQNPISISAGVVGLQYDNSTLNLLNGALRVAPNGITSLQLNGSSVPLDAASGKVVNVLPVANGGTGANGAAGARVALQAAGFYQTTNPNMAADTWLTITHGLNTAYPIVQVYDTSTGEVVDLDIRSSGNGTIDIRAGAAYTSGALTIKVVG